MRAKTGTTGRGTPRVPTLFYQFIQNALGVLMPQRLILQFTGAPVTVSDDGANNRTIVDLSGVVAASQIIFGSGFTNITTTKVWLQPGNGPDAPLITDTHRVIAPRSGTLRNMYVKHNVPGPDATNLTYTVEINGAGTLLAVTLAASAASGSNLVNSAAVLQGQEIAVSLTKAAGLTQEVLRPVISMEYA